MAYEQRDLTGSLFKNDRKEKDTHAEYRGSALIEGAEYWLDAWVNQDRNGNKYMSLKFKRKEAREDAPRQQGGGGTSQSRPQPAAFDTDLDDDVPF
jgi:hypothetical protein